MILPILLAASIKIPAAIYGTAEGLDLLSTEYNLSIGLKEQNPLMRNRSVRMTYTLALASGMTYLDVRMQKKNKDTKKLRIAYTVLKGTVIFLNIKAARKKNAEQY